MIMQLSEAPSSLAQTPLLAEFQGSLFYAERICPVGTDQVLHCAEGMVTSWHDDIFFVC